ncbi:plasmid partitioning protein RepA [Sinirhodobacter populi]|uniref:Plasmid partitioning protein RepA n=1 Tax=Paenirhodobacter populi TaxID=2306993 RepID=A0A443KCT2_9RHOB|nr:plasmid partitioning protein RepA [Sinirhodobacter populi]
MPVKANSASIADDARALTSSLKAQIERIYEPTGRKSMRRLHIKEVADLLGVTDRGIRHRQTIDKQFPAGETDNRNRRYFNMDDLWLMRRRFAEKSKNPKQFLPGRSEGDKLQVVSVANFKGGSGKSTTTAHLAHRLTMKGYRVLAIDMDPQASLTVLFGYRPELDFAEGDGSKTIYDALRYDEYQVPLSQVIRPTYCSGLDLAPAGLQFSEFETETAYALSRGITPSFESRLTLLLDEVEDRYDVVLIDCPPQLGFSSLCAIAASSSVLVTVIPNMLDISSMAQFLTMSSSLIETISEAKRRPVEFDFFSYLLTRYEPSDGPQVQMAGYLRGVLGSSVLTNPILKSTAISDAGMTQQTIYEISQSSMVKKTLERALTSMNNMAAEVEQLIQRAWGR